MKRWLGPVAVVAVLVAGCTTEAPEDDQPSGHEHGAGDVLISQPVGDGTQATEAGYRIADVSLPKQAATTGQVSFRIVDFDDRPVTKYLEEQTRELHLYVVSEDLSVFRHLHPTRDDQAVWSSRVTLPRAGDYRVVAEFIAQDPGGNGDHIVLGAKGAVPGPKAPEGQITIGDEPAADEPIGDEPVGSDGVVSAEVDGDLTVGPNGRLTVVVRDAQDRPVRLGTYLGTFAHVTGFRREDGAVVHLHPLGQPEIDGDATRLEIHTEFEEAGEYVFYVQVRVDGFLHTLRSTATVS